MWELREGNEKQAGPGKGRIRPAEESDLSRIGEIFVFNNRMYYWPIFQDDEYSFNVMQVVPVINAYFGKEENRKRIFVYDDGLVKGFCELGEKEIRKLYVEPFFQSNRRSQREKLVRRCTVALVISGILFIAVAVGACLYLQGPSLIG